MAESSEVVVRATSAPIIPDIKKKKGDKIKVLWYSDFLKHTGFGNVAEEIMERLLATGKYEFEVLAINHHGDPYNIPGGDYFKFKDIPIHPASSNRQDIFGYQKLAELLSKTEFDILFILQDSFNLIPMKAAISEAKKFKDFRYIFYFPVDGDMRKEWITDGVQVADFPVTYTQYGVDKVKKISPSINLPYIYHGADLKTFKPFDSEKERDEFRKDYFFSNSEDKEFIITNVNRNQPRKDLPRFLMAFSLFCERYPEIPAKIYVHCKIDDMAGNNIHDITTQYIPYDIIDRVILPSPNRFGGNGLPLEMLVKIYGASDVITSTTLGEGWGLSTTEAMACKVPVVMPNNSATTEIIGKNEERGYLAKSGGHPNLYVVQKHDHDLIRPLTDLEDLVLKWKQVYDNKEEAQAKVNAAYEWLQDKTWDHIGDQWHTVFQEAYSTLNK